MTLFGDALKGFNTAQQIPMLPAMLAMKGAGKAGAVLKNNTVLGKTVKNTTSPEQKRIWRGSRFLRKHILEVGIGKLNTLTGGMLKKGVDRYADYHAYGKKLAERNAAPGLSTVPSPLSTKALLSRYKEGTSTLEDLELLDRLNLAYNPLTDSLATPEALKASSQDEILKRFMENQESMPSDTKALLDRLDTHALTEQDQQVLRAFGLRARLDGSLERLNELPLSPPEQKLCAYFDDRFTGKQGLKIQDIKDDILKLNLRTLRAGQFEKLAEGMSAVFQELNLDIKEGKLVEVKVAKPLPPLPQKLTEQENTLNPTEKELYQLLSNTKEDIQQISDMQNPALRVAFTKIKEGKLQELDPRIQTSLNTLGLKIQDGKVLGNIKIKIDQT